MDKPELKVRARALPLPDKSFAPALYLSLLLLAVLFLSGCATTTTATATSASPEAGEEWLLDVSSDEESTEKRIASYFREQYDVEAEYHFLDEDDLYLEYGFAADEGEFPAIAVYVDTVPSALNEDEGGTVTERRVTITAYYVLADAAKTPANRAAILEQINLWHVERWVPQRIYLDEDGDIVLESTVNIPGDEYPVHAEIVGDQILRMYSAWSEFYQELNDKLGGRVLDASLHTAHNR